MHPSFSAISPEPIVDLVDDRFRLGVQEDASEFFLHLMATLNSPTLEEIIRVSERQRKQCELCGHTEYKDESPVMLSHRQTVKGLCLFLAIPNLFHATMDGLLQYHCRAQNREFKCVYDGVGGCNGTGANEAQVMTSLTHIGEVLIVVLKRFDTPHQKNIAAINFNEIQKFTVYSEDPQEEPINRYKPLVAAIFHSGNLKGGHNIACAKDAASKSWFKFDDEKVEPVQFWEVADMNEDVYILVYGSDVPEPSPEKKLGEKGKPREL